MHGKVICSDCGAEITHKATTGRCRSCAAKQAYIKRYGHPPERLILVCEVCGLQFTAYKSDKAAWQHQHGVYFCSPECRAAWVGVANSVARGGDGAKRSKPEKDKLDYMAHADARRAKQRERYRLNRDAILSGLRDKARQAKLRVVAAYGGRCACCGETAIEFLTIDHVNGGGNVHRREVGKGRGVYADLERQGFPQDGYRVLCFNCNIARGFYGYCPHHPEERKTPERGEAGDGRPRSIK